MAKRVISEKAMDIRFTRAMNKVKYNPVKCKCGSTNNYCKRGTGPHFCKVLCWDCGMFIKWGQSL